MQRGSLALVSRKEEPDVWQFRWSEKDLHGVRVQRERVIGTVERYPDGAAARTAMTIVLAELNSGKARISCIHERNSLRTARQGTAVYPLDLSRTRQFAQISTNRVFRDPVSTAKVRGEDSALTAKQLQDVLVALFL